MSKSWRREAERASRREVKDRFVRKVEAPTDVSPEWAMKRMEKHITFVIKNLVRDKQISVCEADDLRSMANIRICAALPRYDREGSEGHNGSILNFLTTVVDNEISNFLRSVERLKRSRTALPIGRLPEDAAERLGFVSDEELGDGARSVREVELRMDVHTLCGMMLPIEFEVLKRRIDGDELSAIARDLGVTRHRLLPVLRAIRRKAIFCGFEPPVVKGERKVQDEF